MSIVSLNSKIFSRLLDNRLLDHHENCDLFHYFQHNPRSFCLAADLLMYIGGTIPKACNILGATQALDIVDILDIECMIKYI